MVEPIWPASTLLDLYEAYQMSVKFAADDSPVPSKSRTANLLSSLAIWGFPVNSDGVLSNTLRDMKLHVVILGDASNKTAD